MPPCAGWPPKSRIGGRSSARSGTTVRALLGLALLGDAAALARIGQHASDRDDPLAPEARAALRIVQAN